MIIGFAGRMQVGKDLSAKIVQCLMYENSNPEYPLEKKIEDIVTSPSMIFSPKGIRGFVNIEFESKWKVVKFADKLKDIICLLIGCTREQLEDPIFKEQELGEEWWYYTHEYDDRLFDTKEKAIKTASYYYVNIGKHSISLNDWLEKIIVIHKPTPRFLMQHIGTDLFRNQLHPNCWVNATMTDYIPVERELKGSLFYPQWIISDVRFPNEAQAIKERGGILIQLIRKDAPISDHISETALDNYNNFNYIIKNNETVEDLKNQIENILKIEGIL